MNDISDLILGAGVSLMGSHAKPFYYIESLNELEDSALLQKNPFSNRFFGYLTTKSREVVLGEDGSDVLKIDYASQVLFTVPRSPLKIKNENGNLVPLYIIQGGFIVIEKDFYTGTTYSIEKVIESPVTYKLVLQQGRDIGVRPK